MMRLSSDVEGGPQGCFGVRRNGVARRALWASLLAGVMCLAGGPAAAQVLIKGTGASFPSLVYQRWTQRFSQLNPSVAVSYSATGSGEGVKQSKSRLVNFGGSDSPLSPEDLKRHHLIQIPMLVGGLVPVVNLPSLGTNQLLLSGDLLADIMLGEVNRWDDARIAALNPAMKLPALAITRVVRQDASGSTEVCVRYLAQSSARFKAAVPVSNLPVWPGQPMRANGNDGVAAALKATVGGITYVSFDRVGKERLTAVRLRTANGNEVAASEAAFRAAILASDLARKGDDGASLLSMPRADAWPITATSYVLIDASPKDMVLADWTARFLYWCFMHGDELTRGTGFAPLPDRVQAMLVGRLLQIHGPSGEVPQFIQH